MQDLASRWILNEPVSTTYCPAGAGTGGTKHSEAHTQQANLSSEDPNKAVLVRSLPPVRAAAAPPEPVPIQHSQSFLLRKHSKVTGCPLARSALADTHWTSHRGDSEMGVAGTRRSSCVQDWDAQPLDVTKSRGEEPFTGVPSSCSCISVL